MTFLAVDFLAELGIGPILLGGLVLGATFVYIFVRYFLQFVLEGKF